MLRFKNFSDLQDNQDTPAFLNLMRIFEQVFALLVIGLLVNFRLGKYTDSILE